MKPKEYHAKMAAIQATNLKILESGVCPQCGSKLKFNIAITGWVQCACYPDPSRRQEADRNKPSCSFQMFMNR